MIDLKQMTERELKELKQNIRKELTKRRIENKTLEVYKGFKIEVEKIDDGYSLYVYKISNENILIDEWDPTIEYKKDAIKKCKKRIDSFIKYRKECLSEEFKKAKNSQITKQYCFEFKGLGTEDFFPYVARVIDVDNKIFQFKLLKEGFKTEYKRDFIKVTGEFWAKECEILEIMNNGEVAWYLVNNGELLKILVSEDIVAEFLKGNIEPEDLV